MLDIGPVAADRAAYYLRAAGAIGPGGTLATGRWLGRGAARLGLEAAVAGPDLAAILEGRDPRDGASLRPDGRPLRVPGRDLVFLPPKSVSVLFGLSDPLVAAEVAAAHERAAEDALAFLERALVVDAGREPPAGLVHAGFAHATSRTDDPLLHLHAVTANLAGRPEGTWARLDFTSLFGYARAVGDLYHAGLRHELTRRLGVRWGPSQRGVQEVEGVPRPVLRAFSTRRVAIENALAAAGRSGPRAARIAARATRPAASRRPVAELRPGWRARAHGLGFGPAALEATLDRGEPEPLGPALEAARDALAGPDGVMRWSSFDRRDVIRGLCAGLPGGAPTDRIVQSAEAFLGNERVTTVSGDGTWCRDRTFRTPSGRLVPLLRHLPRFGSTELLRREHGLAVAAGARRGALPAGLSPEAVAEVLVRVRLSAGERRVAERLLAGADPVVLIRAGSAWSTASVLDAARRAWATAGAGVLAASVDRQAARDLEDGTGIPTGTFDGLLADLAAGALPAGRPGAPGPAAVLVLDAAQALGTDRLEELLARAGNAKLLLVADRRLPEHDRAGVVRAIEARGLALHLAGQRGQLQPNTWGADPGWARSPAVGIGRIAGAGGRRIVLAPDAARLRAALVADWIERSATGPAYLVARRAAERHALAELSRAAGGAPDAVLTPRQARGVHGDLLVLGRRPPALAERGPGSVGDVVEYLVLPADLRADRELGIGRLAPRTALAVERPEWVGSVVGGVPERIGLRATWLAGIELLAATEASHRGAPLGPVPSGLPGRAVWLERAVRLEAIQGALGVPAWNWRAQVTRELGGREPVDRSAPARELELDLGR